ncbi:hypothetical protein TB2_030075 [Malus domestica]
MTNQVSKFHKIEKLSKPSQVSTANSESAEVLGKGKINLMSDKIDKSLETTSQRECIFDVFPLPRIGLNNASTRRGSNNDEPHAPPTEGNNEGIYPDGSMFDDDSDNQDNLQSVVENLNECETTVPAPRCNPMHNRQPRTRFQDFVTYNPKHPISNYVSYQKLTPSHAAFLSTISSHSEPQNFHEANNQDVWKEAMKEELKALDVQKT